MSAKYREVLGFEALNPDEVKSMKLKRRIMTTGDNG